MSIIEKYRAMMAEPKQRVAFSSVVAAIVLVLIKLYVGILTNSLGILSEALHSGLDLLAAAITWAAVYSANKPPDSEHQFGHGKFENFSALIETILLLITCIWIIWEAIDRILYTTEHAEANLIGFGVMLFSIILNYSRAKALKFAAKKYNSQALEADALHFESDIWGSIVVIIGLGFVYIGFPLGDPISALLVAAIIIYASIELGKRTV
ncbi:MAG: cation diffusion facilitator family transporter, partial [Thermoplasmata archaeon]